MEDPTVAAGTAHDDKIPAPDYAAGPPDLAAIAEALGGEVYGREVRAPAPGQAASDRGLRVRLRPGSYFGIHVTNAHSANGVADETDPDFSHVVDTCGLKAQRRSPRLRLVSSQPKTVAPPQPQIDEIFPVICPTEWASLPIPKRDWLVDGMIPNRTVTLLSGDGGVGKSLLALQMAVAMALEVKTAGLDIKPGRALYLAAEDERDELHRRIAEIVGYHGRALADLANLKLVPLADRDALLSIPERDGTMKPTANWLWFAMVARDFRPNLIVLDTSADLFGGDEIKRNQVRDFVGMLRKLAMEIDCSILLLSHPSVSGMASGSGISGSTAWNNSVRSRLYLTMPPAEKSSDPDPDGRVLTQKKINYGRNGGEYRLRWEAGVFVSEADVSPLLAKAAASRVDDLFLSLLAKLNRQEHRLGVKTGVNYAPAVMASHPDAKGVSKAQLGQAMTRLLDADTIRVVIEGPPSRSRQRLVLSSADFGPLGGPQIDSA